MPQKLSRSQGITQTTMMPMTTEPKNNMSYGDTIRFYTKTYHTQGDIVIEVIRTVRSFESVSIWRMDFHLILRFKEYLARAS